MQLNVHFLSTTVMLINMLVYQENHQGPVVYTIHMHKSHVNSCPNVHNLTLTSDLVFTCSSIDTCEGNDKLDIKHMVKVLKCIKPDQRYAQHYKSEENNAYSYLCLCVDS